MRLQRQHQPSPLGHTVWLTAALNPLPTVSASESTISAVVNGASSGAAVFRRAVGRPSPGRALLTRPARVRSGSTGDFNGNLLPTAIKGTSVLINGRQASVEFVKNGQVNVQVPDNLYTGAMNVEIISPLGVAAGTASLELVAPAIFPVNAGSASYAAAVGIDGLLIAPPEQVPAARLAHPGKPYRSSVRDSETRHLINQRRELITGAPLANTVTASICGQSATVSYGGLVSPGLGLKST